MISNYIPHRKPISINYNKWKNYFYDDLLYLYEIILAILKNRHNDNINISFNTFCLFIFKNSSKYIPKY